MSLKDRTITLAGDPEELLLGDGTSSFALAVKALTEEMRQRDEAEGRTIDADWTFSGKGVHGSVGMDIGIASKLLKRVGEVHGGLSPKTHVFSGTAKGSFGFRIQSLQQDWTGHSPIDDLVGALEALAKDDAESAAAALEKLPEKARRALQLMMSEMHRRNGSLAIRTSGRHVVLRGRQLEYSLQPAGASPKNEAATTTESAFTGRLFVLPNEHRFELIDIDAATTLVKGLVASELDQAELLESIGQVVTVLVRMSDKKDAVLVSI